MKKHSKLIPALAVALVAIIVIFVVILKTAGWSLDVVSRDSAASFEQILTASGEKVTADAESAGWSLQAPDGSVRFIWGAGNRSPYDAMLELDAQPFINAGLDLSKLPEYYTASAETLMVGTNLSDGQLAAAEASTPLQAYQQIVRQSRSSIGYHSALDHYNISLGNGNLFEWAKNIQANSITGEDQDKDIVFVLDPEALVAAGVNPEQVEDWVYTTVNVEINGKATDVYKFLKPFNLQ